MTDFLSALSTLRRPRLLIRAARHGMLEYNRSRDLKRITRGDVLPPPDRALSRLMALEADQEASRTAGDAAYSPARHVDILSALMGEARLLLRRPGPA